MQRERLLSPRAFGLSMIGLGLFTLLAAIGHRRQMKVMKKSYGSIQFSLAELLAAVISAFGLVAFLAVVLRQ